MCLSVFFVCFLCIVIVTFVLFRFFSITISVILIAIVLIITITLSFLLPSPLLFSLYFFLSLSPSSPISPGLSFAFSFSLPPLVSLSLYFSLSPSTSSGLTRLTLNHPDVCFNFIVGIDSYFHYNVILSIHLNLHIWTSWVNHVIRSDSQPIRWDTRFFQPIRWELVIDSQPISQWPNFKLANGRPAFRSPPGKNKKKKKNEKKR